MNTRKPARASAAAVERPYLDSRGLIGTIFGSFFLLCVPVTVLQLSNISTNATVIGMFIVTLVGLTHFLITFALYLNSSNLAFFAGSLRNRIVYFLIPIVILTGFCAIGVFTLNQLDSNPSARFLVYLFTFTVAVKAVDYFHVVRQSFGMLQLFKRQASTAFPGWMRTTDNGFFLSMFGLQLLSFTRGLKVGDFELSVFTVHGLFTRVMLGVAIVLFLAVLTGFASAWKTSGDARKVGVPLAYFLMQTASASLPVYKPSLYLASLSMHYVEYHVIMFPRLFKAELNPDSRVDRLAQWLRRHKVVFYALMVGVALWIVGKDFLGNWMPIDRRSAIWLLMNAFNGIFVAHFFVEAFVWKFGNPYYRKSLSPLYFPAPRTS